MANQQLQRQQHKWCPYNVDIFCGHPLSYTSHSTAVTLTFDLLN